MKRPVITLLTDFGTADHYVAAMKGVILGICPQANIVDISHEVQPYAIAEGAYTLAQAWQYFPKGTVHVAVVDPGVGSDRLPIAVEVAGHRFVAPDNGILAMVLDGHQAKEIREISNQRFFRRPVSPTFHGRDIFAPAAAYLARGETFRQIGKVLKNTSTGAWGKPLTLRAGSWSGSVLKIDRFGNVITNLEGKNLSGKHFQLKVGKITVKHLVPTYAAAPAGLFAVVGSSGYIEVSLNQGDAARELRVKAGTAVYLSTKGNS